MDTELIEIIAFWLVMGYIAFEMGHLLLYTYFYKRVVRTWERRFRKSAYLRISGE